MANTKKDELIFSTSDPKEMMNHYLAERVIRSWTEDFVDEDSGEVVSVERKEVIADKGTFLDNDSIPEIMFYIQSGEIKSVEISNQKRQGNFVVGSSIVWMANVEVGGKNTKILLYANSSESATEIVKDFVELHYTGFCRLTLLKEYGNCIIIEEVLTEAEQEENDIETKLYKIEVNVLIDESVSNYTFIVYSTDVESALATINNWITKFLKSKDSDSIPEFSTTIETAVIVTFHDIIEKEFSMAYIKDIEKENPAPGLYVSSSSKVESPTKPDNILHSAAKAIVESQNGSTSFLQRKFSIGYNRAGRIMDQLEGSGIIGPFCGAKSREVLIKTLDELKHHLETNLQISYSDESG